MCPHLPNGEAVTMLDSFSRGPSSDRLAAGLKLVISLHSDPEMRTRLETLPVDVNDRMNEYFTVIALRQKASQGS